MYKIQQLKMPVKLPAHNNEILTSLYEFYFFRHNVKSKPGPEMFAIP